MDMRALKLLEKEKVCVMAVILPDGGCHGAALHFSYQADPLVIYIQTESTSVKCRKLPTKASVVVGVSEDTMQTLQMDGDVCQVTDLSQVYKIHYARHPGAEKYKSDPTCVLLAFTPTWWRYSDYMNNTFLSSND
jgi:general stress protein 26